MKLYKFANPMDANETDEVYIMLEDRGDRALYQIVDTSGIFELVPTFVFNKKEMVEIA